MSIIQTIKNNLSDWNPFSSNKLDATFTELDKGGKKRYSHQLLKTYLSASEVGQDELKQAINAAEDPYYPNRYLLQCIYKEAKRDFHLRSQMKSAILKVTKNAFVVTDGNDNIEAELSKLIEKQWFYKTIYYHGEAEFEGLSLLEVQQLIMTELGIEISDVKLFDRYHVIPERGEIKKNVWDQKGLRYRGDEEISQWFIEAGDPLDLGLLHIAAKYSLYKKYALSDWSIYLEKYGNPIVDYASASMDKTENDEKEKWAKNLGRNGYLVRDIDDEVTLLSPKEGTGYEVFKANIDLQDQENSKGINGQVGSSDEKAFVGSAKVHENLFDDYTTARMRNLTFWLNDTLLPYLVNLNGGNTAYAKLAGKEIKPLFLLHEDEDEESSDPLDDEEFKNTNNRKPGGAPKNLGKSFKGLRM